MAGALYWPVGTPRDLGLYLSDCVLESKLLSRDDRLVERRIDCFQFIHESVSAAIKTPGTPRVRMKLRRATDQLQFLYVSAFER